MKARQEKGEEMNKEQKTVNKDQNNEITQLDLMRQQFQKIN